MTIATAVRIAAPYPPPSKPPSNPLPAPPPPSKQARVLVGPAKTEFIVDRGLLAAISPFFSDSLEASSKSNKHHHMPCIWLAGEAPAMFELFVVWLHHRASFRQILDTAVNIRASPSDRTSSTPSLSSSLSISAGNPDADSNQAQKLHWGLVRLHLFAARLSLFRLQDAAMDALQDLYLRRDWDVTPRLIRFLYGSSAGASDAGVRIRRWAVAMVAWQLSSASDEPPASGPPSSPSHFEQLTGLLARHSGLRAEYDAHVGKMTSSGLEVSIKNPQLRISANDLRSEERMFAFRQCSFHSHRAAVGEGQCPHMMVTHKIKMPATTGSTAVGSGPCGGGKQASLLETKGGAGRSGGKRVASSGRHPPEPTTGPLLIQFGHSVWV